MSSLRGPCGLLQETQTDARVTEEVGLVAVYHILVPASPLGKDSWLAMVSWFQDRRTGLNCIATKAKRQRLHQIHDRDKSACDLSTVTRPGAA